MLECSWVVWGGQLLWMRPLDGAVPEFSGRSLDSRRVVSTVQRKASPMSNMTDNKARGGAVAAGQFV